MHVTFRFSKRSLSQRSMNSLRLSGGRQPDSPCQNIRHTALADQIQQRQPELTNVPQVIPKLQNEAAAQYDSAERLPVDISLRLPLPVDTRDTSLQQRRGDAAECCLTALDHTSDSAKCSPTWSENALNSLEEGNETFPEEDEQPQDNVPRGL